MKSASSGARCQRSGVGRIPNDLLLVGRAIGLMDGINRQLAPEVDAVELVARYAQDS